MRAHPIHSLLLAVTAAAPGQDLAGGSVPLGATPLANFELHVDFVLPPGADGGVTLGDVGELVLAATGAGGLRGVAAPLVEAGRPAGQRQALEVRFRHDRGRPAVVSAWLNGAQVLADFVVPGTQARPGLEGLRREWPVAESPRFTEGAFALYVRFTTRGDGTLVARAPAGSTPWAARGKALFVRGGRVVYDIGWVGALTSRSRFDDGVEHTAILTHDRGTAFLYVDGQLEGQRAEFATPDVPEHVLKVGATSTNFGGALLRGEVAEVVVLGEPLPRDAATRSELPRRAPALRWVSAGAPVGNDETVAHVVRLRAGDPPIRFERAWTRPLSDVDHGAWIAALDDAARERGRKTYHGVCAACHGADGETVTLPTARPFSTAKLENGADPLALYQTLTRGFRTMPPQTWLTPAQRYDVVHYLRETFLRERNPSQYTVVDAAYLAGLPKPLPAYPDQVGSGDGLAFRDFGPGLIAQVGGGVPAGLAVHLPHEMTIAYDLHTMASVGAWRGAFLDLAETHHHQQRGEGIARPGAAPWGWTTHWGPVVDRTDKPPRGPAGAITRVGHHVAGRELTLSYRVSGRGVLEAPTAVAVGGEIALVHRLRVAAGETSLRWAWGSEVLGDDVVVDGVARRSHADGGFVAAVVVGDPQTTTAVHWAGGHLVVPAAARDLVFTVIRAAGKTDAEFEAFRAWAKQQGRAVASDPAELLRGGDAQEPAPELVTRGVLGASEGAYAVDTLTLPDTTAVGAWLRTTALAFFADGRAAVSTLGGDVWIVSGIDADLHELHWRRFASGLFEPLGLAVVDEKVIVTCRDGLIRLHDHDADGTADFYECAYADTDVTASFHAFNFDLQRLPSGELCYVKAGRYTQFTLPGAVVAVHPTDGTARYLATGFRTPNGMGLLPDGSLTVSDNQGNWVPASKISKIRAGGFYGVFRTDAREREDFDRPFLWLPQSVDSSSGGQVWLGDARFGPLAGRLLHTSFGKGWAYAVTMDEVDGVTQASCVTLPFQFQAGVQRARINPRDGQAYLVGLSGWQGPPDGADGCLQRLRHTGRAEALLLGARVVTGGIELDFSTPLEAASVVAKAFAVQAWSYRWAARYGSAHWSVRQPDREGQDRLAVTRAVLADGGRRVALTLPDLQPCDQVEVVSAVRAADGTPVNGTVYLTVRALR